MSVTQILDSGSRFVKHAMDGTLAIPQYCLLFHDTDDVKPAASMTDQLTEAENQSYFAKRFAGIAMDSRGTADTDAQTTFPVATDVELVIDCSSATFEVGDYVAAVEAAGGTSLENLKVKKTTDPARAIGRVTKRYGSATTSVQCRLQSSLVTVPVDQPGVYSHEVTFTEDGDTTYTGTVTVPAGATIIDIIVENTVLWDDGTSAAIVVGDGDDPDGYFASTNLKATDLLADQTINFDKSGGKEGAYLTGTSTHWTNRYSASERQVSGVVTTGGQDGSAGRTRMTVVYSLPASVTAATGA